MATNGPNDSDDPMSVAFAEARAAEARGEAPIGAAIARDGAVIASAGNRTRGDCRSDRPRRNARDPRGRRRRSARSG